MIKLVADPTFEHLVRLTIPGEAKPAEVLMKFKHMTAAQRQAWYESKTQDTVSKAVAEILLGWRGVLGEDGKEVEFSSEALEQLLQNYGAAADEIVRGWLLGLTESRVKN